MSRQYCFLCATDEGVFLDITADNKQKFHEQFEICALAKVPTTDQLPTKICHKCAFELNQCSSFVQKYKLATKQQTNAHKDCCSLCFEPAKNKFVFDLNKDKSLQLNLLDKVEKVFNCELAKFHEGHKLVCLSCRYTVDVLLDLKNVCMETSAKFNKIINEEIDYLNFPKIKTTVVSRKTTVTESARTNLLDKLESNFDKMTRTRSQNNKLSNTKSNTKMSLRVCNKCQNCVKASEHVYKIHKTGDTVCRSCWKTMDVYTSEIESQTKLCTVFLTDVLKTTDGNEKSLYRIDEDDQGNKIFVVTDKKSVNENKSDKASGVLDGTGRQGLKRSIKSLKYQDNETNHEDAANKKHKPDAKEASNIESVDPETVSHNLRRQKQKGSAHDTNQRSDSDSSVKVSTKRNGRILTRHKRATGSSLSDADVDSKSNRKKLSTILKGITTLKNIDASDESSSNDDVGSRRKRIRFTSASPVTIDSEPTVGAENSTERSVSSRAIRSQRKQSKSRSVASEESQSLESDEKEVIFETETYVCDECGASYENKLMGLTHKLSHYKQPKLKLHRLREKSLEKEVLRLSEVVHDLTEDPSETLAITVDDDEEEAGVQSNDLTTNDDKEMNSDAGSKTHSPRKEAVEDAVDVELVLKESDDDHLNQTKKHSDEDEKNETSVTNSSTQDEKIVAEDQDERSTSKNNYNDKTENSVHELAENEVENSKVQDISHGDSADTVEEHKGDEKKRDEEEKNEGEAEKEVEKSLDVAEKEKEERVDCDESINTKDNEEEQEVAIVDKENSSTFKTNCEESTAEENGVDSSKEVQCSETEKEEARNKVEIVLEDSDDVEEILEEESSSQLSQETTSCKENEMQTKMNTSDFEKSEVVLDTALEKEGSETGKDDVKIVDIETSQPEIYEQQTKSTNDSTNAAAEVLQEVLDLANAEVQKRQGVLDKNTENNSFESETLENISREIHNTVDIPALKSDDAKSEVDAHPK